MTTLTDTVRIEAPKRSPVQPVSPLDPLVGRRFRVPTSERLFEVRARSGSATQWDRLAMGRGQPLWREAA